jgi:hypothetical protein
MLLEMILQKNKISMSYQNTWGWNHKNNLWRYEIWTQKTQSSIAPLAVIIALQHTNHMEICLQLQMEYNISKQCGPYR